MVSARLVNVSPFPRRTWVSAAFPQALVADIDEEARFVTDDRAYRAVRGADRGDISTIFHVDAELDGSQTIVGELQPSAVEALPFAVHPFVIDDVPALLPIVELTSEIGDVITLRPTEGVASLEGATPARQRWRIDTQHPSGMRLTWFFDLYANSPVVRAWGALIWSFRGPGHDLRFPTAKLISGELFIADSAWRHGWSAPYRSARSPDESTLAWHIDLGALSFIDGSGVPITGFILATPTGMQDEWHRDRDLVAAERGEAVGVATEWPDWLGVGHAPRLRSEGSHVDAAWSRFEGLMQTPAGLYVPRPLGLTPSPGQTGDQEDFGACKGTLAVTLGDPRHIIATRYSALADFFRGFCHYEADGSILTAANHPQWETWSGYTHARSSDKLGKPAVGWYDRRATGWFNYDDQHRSQNNLAALGALEDNPLVDLLIRHAVETDLAGIPFRTGKLDSMRGQGRPLLCWTALQQVSPAPEVEDKLELLIAKRLEVARGALTSGPVSIISATGPDGRKPIYERDVATGELIRDTEGRLVLAETASMWELGLALVGFACAPDESVLPALCRTILRYGVFCEGPEEDQYSRWHLVADILHRGGQGPTAPLSLELGAGEGKQIILAAGSGVGGWVLPGLMVAVHTLRERTSDGPQEDAELVVKGMKAIAYHTMGVEASALRDAEWWAVVPSIASVAYDWY